MSGTRGIVHIDQALSNFSLKYSNGAMIADYIAQRVNVAKESDKYFVYGKQDFDPKQTARADKTDPNFIDSFKIESTPTYVCEEHSLADLVSDRERKNSDAPISPDYDVTTNLTNLIMLAREKRVADLLTTAANYATSGNTVTLVGVQQFNDLNYDSDSLVNAIEVRIDAAKEAIRRSIGRDPNFIIIPSAVARVVKRDESVRALEVFTHDDLLINGDLPPTLWNMKVYIPGSIINSANPGQAFSGSDVWGKNIVLGYNEPNPMTPRVMTGVLSFQSQARGVNKWRVDARKSDAIEVAEVICEKMVSEYCLYLIKDCIA